MENIWLTIILASVAVLFALIGLGIGWLISGRQRLKGSCGRTGKEDAPCEVCKKDKCDE